MCLAQGHSTVTPVRLKPAAPRSRVKHSTTEPLRSHDLGPNCLQRSSEDEKFAATAGKGLTAVNLLSDFANAVKYSTK